MTWFKHMFMASELASEMYVDDLLTGDGFSVILDSPGSVSGLRRDEINMIFDEEIIDEQCQRHFHQLELF